MSFNYVTYLDINNWIYLDSMYLRYIDLLIEILHGVLYQKFMKRQYLTPKLIKFMLFFIRNNQLIRTFSFFKKEMESEKEIRMRKSDPYQLR